MRREFKPELLKAMKQDERIICFTADLGYKFLDEIRDNFEAERRFLNCGSSEQLMLGMAVGAALEGKIPICYSITPFLLRRPYEWIHLYLHGEQIPVKLIGGGRDKDYSHDGPSHDASDDKKIMANLCGIEAYWPADIEEMKIHFEEMLYNNKPSYLNLRR
jgi:transketolase